MMLKLSFLIVAAVAFQLSFEALGVLNMYPDDITQTGFGDVQAAAVQRADIHIRSCNKMTQWFISMVIGIDPQSTDTL